MILRNGICVVVLLLLGSSSPAQYRTYGPSQPQYHRPVVHHQPHHPPPYEVVPPAQKVFAQEVAVAPLLITVPVDSKAVPVQAFGNPYYYSIGETYREKAYLRDLLREELRVLLGGQAASQSTTTTTQSTQSSAYLAGQQVASLRNAVAGQTQTQPQALSLLPDQTTPPELQQRLMAAYQGVGNCLSCHGSDNPQGGKGKPPFRLIANDSSGKPVLLKQSSDKRWKIYGMAKEKVMPPDANRDASKAMEPQHLPALLQYAALLDD